MQPPTDKQVQSFLQRPPVAAAIAAPRSPHSALSFWFGCDFSNPSALSSLSGPAGMQLFPIWFKGTEPMDEACRAFTDVIRELRAGTLSGPEWTDTTEGKLARVLLADQFARNAFRGTNEAYGYADIALGLSRELVNPEGGMEGLPAVVMSFVGVSLVHSEELVDHDNCIEFNARMQVAYPEMGFLRNQKMFIDSHRDVIVKFGRYPHRNVQCGRKTTAEEQVWLDDEEIRPAWSKGT